MTREQKIREARTLRAEGLTALEIGARLGISDSTVRNWCLGGDCEECGAPVEGSSKLKSRLCQECGLKAFLESRRSAACERAEDFIRMRLAGKLNVDIARERGFGENVVAQVFSRAHLDWGLDVPPSPYWLRGKSNR